MVVSNQEGRKLLPLGGIWCIYYIIKKGEIQEVMKKFWFVSLCALLIIASAVGWNVPIRIAVGANAIVILINIGKNIREVCNGRTEKEN